MNIIQRITRYRDKRLRLWCVKRQPIAGQAHELYRFITAKYKSE